MRNHFHEALHEVEMEDVISRLWAESYTQEIICQHFGCGKTLTLEERLCGNRCKDHQKTSEIDVTKFVSY